MGRGKIEHETKREKRDFRLGGMQEDREESRGGESKVSLPLKEIISVCVCVCVCVKAKKNKRDFSLTMKHTQELL